MIVIISAVHLLFLVKSGDIIQCFPYADSNVSLICVSLMRKFKLFRCEIQEKFVLQKNI